MSTYQLFGVLLLLCLPTVLGAQDPFYTHYYGNEALYNPANVGLHGATTLTFKHKQQWQANGHDGYRTSSALYEESVPCGPFDYGLAFTRDREGAGRLLTNRVGGMLAYTAMMGRDRRSGIPPLDLRIGGGLNFGQQSVDFGRLTFLDQLHPKYGFFDREGNPNPTAFLAPNSGQSVWYFQPSAGIHLRGLAFPNGKKPIFYSLGLAVHNLVPLLGSAEGHSWSILGIEAPTIPRYTMHFEFDVPLTGRKSRDFLALSPRLAMQSQGPLAYLETGVNLGLNQRMALGFSLHTARTQDAESVGGQSLDAGPATRWGALAAEFAAFPVAGQRIDFGFSYAFNLSGLRNFVGNTYEVTVRYSFASSFACRATGKSSGFSGDRTLVCPTARGGRGKNKIYENIWYKTGVLDK